MSQMVFDDGGGGLALVQPHGRGVPHPVGRRLRREVTRCVTGVQQLRIGLVERAHLFEGGRQEPGAALGDHRSAELFKTACP